MPRYKMKLMPPIKRVDRNDMDLRQIGPIELLCFAGTLVREDDLFVRDGNLVVAAVSQDHSGASGDQRPAPPNMESDLREQAYDA